jgi:hypothetical protein
VNQDIAGDEMEIPEEEWNSVRILIDRITRREYEQADDCRNLRNLLYSLHGDGVRNREYTKDNMPAVFVKGKWEYR